MDRQSIFKLKAGQTLYTVGLEHGTVEAICVRRIESYYGYPVVHGNWYKVMLYGEPVAYDESEFGCVTSIAFLPGTGEDGQPLDESKFRQTVSKKTAMRWAKEGFARTPKWTNDMVQTMHQLAAEL